MNGITNIMINIIIIILLLLLLLSLLLLLLELYSLLIMHISEENNVKVCLFVVFLRNNRKPTQLVRDRWGSVTVKKPKANPM